MTDILTNVEKEILLIGGAELLAIVHKELVKDIFIIVRDLKILILSNGSKTVKINRKNFCILERHFIEQKRTLESLPRKFG